MSLDATRWANAIAAKISGTGLEGSEISQINAFWIDITTEHVGEITANAIVTTTSGAPDGEHTGNVS